MDKKKYIKIALIFICIISITLIGTYALKLWSSTENTELTFRIGEYQTDSMICKASEDITVSNIGPVFDYMKDGEVIPFTVLASSSNEEKLFINFNIESITDNLKEESFKYVLLSSIDKINYNEITSGNFLNINSNDTIELISDYTINKTTYYKLIIYIDGNMENQISMQNGSIIGNIEVCTDGVLLVTDEVLEAHKETKTDTIEVENEVNKEFSATGAVQNVTLNKGTYKLQVWGAQGGYYSPYKGGQGGYSYGTIILTESTNIYVYVGGAGSSNGTAGFNGGGSSTSTSTSIITGGGASDMRIKNDSLYARVIVAGGGGGSSYYVSGAGGNGGAGGGLSGGAGSSNSFPASGGTISSGGKTLDNHRKVQSEGSFGTGGSVDSNGGIGGSGAGGGGWYGGSGGSRGSNTNSIGSGSGGSGWVYTNENFNSWQSGNSSDASKWELNSNYYLTNAATFTGDTTFESTSGGTETGHSGNGYAKITGTEKYTTTGTVTYYTIPNLTGLTDLKVPLGTSVSLTEGTTLICENNTTTGCSIINISVTDTSTLAEGTHVVTYTVKGTNNKKYLFNRNIIVMGRQSPNSPDLVDGLIPVVYNESTSSWVKADSTNSNNSWYDYDNKKWANAVLVTSTNRNTYQNASAGTTITESDILAYYVWIPRYKYKVWNKNKVIGTDSYSARTTGIDIVFESEKNKTGTISCTYSYAAPSSSANSPNETCTGSNGDYYTHPAFTFGSNNIRGFWMGKFELSSNYPGDEHLDDNYDHLTIRILPNIKTWCNEPISNFNTKIQNMQTSSNIYGLNTSRTNTDSHMITSYEWGAVAYLANSKYGRCINGSCNDITLNGSSSYITGIGGSNVTTTNRYNGTNGVLASTTGNITGVYDMSGGAAEYVMGNMSSGNDSYIFNPSYSKLSSSWYTNSNAKYLVTYTYGPDETGQIAYNRSRLGDAVGEVSVTNSTNWNSDSMTFPSLLDNWAWLLRGGQVTGGASSGIFASYCYDGSEKEYYSSRAILLSLK